MESLLPSKHTYMVFHTSTREIIASLGRQKENHVAVCCSVAEVTSLKHCNVPEYSMTFPYMDMPPFSGYFLPRPFLFHLRSLFISTVCDWPPN